MEDLIEAYLSVYEDSDIKSIAKAAVDHQRHGDYGDADALQKATKAVKKATRYPGRQGPKATPSLPESYDEFDEGFKRMNPEKIKKQAERLKKSGAKDRFGGSRSEVLDTVSKKLDTPDERRFSTDTSRKNKKGVRAHLAARDAALADIEKYGLPESYDELNERIDSEGRYIRDSKPNGGSRIITPTSSTSATKPTKPTKATATKPTKTTSYGMEEEFDLYDVVLDHLLDEGYANTEEDALAIMANMSEEWIDSIFEENDKKQEKGAKWNKGQKLKDPRAQKVFDHMTKKVNETVDLYDVVLEHLLDEGYADTEENAITIMANMSEAWIDGILDEAQIMSVSGPGGLRHMINPNVLKAQNAAARERQGREAREKSKKEAQNAARLDAANRRGIERATNRSDRTDFTPGSALRADERDELPTDYRALRRRAKG